MLDILKFKMQKMALLNTLKNENEQEEKPINERPTNNPQVLNSPKITMSSTKLIALLNQCSINFVSANTNVAEVTKTTFDSNKPTYSESELITLGFNKDEINKWFSKFEISDGSTIYQINDNLSYTKRTLSGVETVTIKTIQELADHFGVTQRKEIIDSGFPAELFNNYFVSTQRVNDGQVSYQLDSSKYTNYKISRSADGKETIITVTRNDGGVDRITVKEDGSYNIETFAINTNSAKK